MIQASRTKLDESAPPTSLSLTQTHKHLPAFWVFLQLPESVGGFHSRLVGGQNKRKFVHIVCRTMTINSQRRKILLFLSTNMAAMTSLANNQLYLYCFTPIVVRSCLEFFVFCILFLLLCAICGPVLTRGTAFLGLYQMTNRT